MTRHILLGPATLEEYVACDDGQGGTVWNRARDFIWGSRWPQPLVMIDRTDLGAVAAGTDEPLYYVRDGLGSTAALTSADGTVVERYTYDAYGTTYVETPGGAARSFSAYGNPFLWTGQRYDAGVGQYHFPARTLWPAWGRWLQRDPLGYVGGVNLYAYVRSGPLRWTDPLGPGTIADSPASVVSCIAGQTNVLAESNFRGDTRLCTPSHPLYVIGRGWTRAEDLRAGDLLESQEGAIPVLSCEGLQLREPVDVFTIRVSGTHTFFVGRLRVLAHNKGA